MDVEHDGIARQVSFPKIFSHAYHFPVGVVTVPTLLVAQAPGRREWHSARQVRKGFDDLRNRTTCYEIIIHIACIGRKTGEAIVGSSEIELRARTVVKINPVRPPVMQSDVKRNG